MTRSLTPLDRTSPDAGADTPREVDVVVVGGGLSGLVAAREVQRRGGRPLVLEARDRVGGRLLTTEVLGVPADLGAHWVGASHRRVRELAAELDIAEELQRVAGRHVTTVGGRRRRLMGELPILPLRETLGAALTILRLELMGRRVPVAEPWRTRGARRLDETTLEDWLGDCRNASTRATFTISSRTMLGLEPHEVSMLAMLALVRAGGGLPYLMGFRGGAQHAGLEGGTQQLATRLADELGPGAVRLGEPVTRIERGSSGVTTRTESGLEVRARAAIIALSPELQQSIAFDPPLPQLHDALTTAMPTGAYCKAILGYERAWWRDLGLSGLAMHDAAPVQMTVDVGPERGPGVLAAFVCGAPARELLDMDEQQRREAITGAVAEGLGASALQPVAYVEHNWTGEPWSAGAPMGVMRPGALTSVAPALRMPVGRLHWAGTERALEAPGYMEGAIDAGERAGAAAATQALRQTAR